MAVTAAAIFLLGAAPPAFALWREGDQRSGLLNWAHFDRTAEPTLALEASGLVHKVAEASGLGCRDALISPRLEGRAKQASRFVAAPFRRSVTAAPSRTSFISALALVITGCGAPPQQKPLAEIAPQEPPPPAVEAPVFPVMPGIEVLATQDFALLRQQRIGLLTHSAAVTRAGEPTWSVLHRAAGVNLIALFAPENGFDGRAPSSTGFAATVHGPTGLPLRSLYALPARKPTKAMLDELDAMVVDLQDIGTRSYTFAAAMRNTLEACFQQGKTVVVLDRPNPLGGLKVDGPPVDPELRSYVSALPVPYVHGLTMGELARFALATPDVLDLDDNQRRNARLIVVPMRGWRRDMRWPDTGLVWRQTSPYVADFAAVEGYPMTGLGCIIGGFTHGVGREHPFRGLAFPGVTADVLISNLSALRIPGLGFRKVEPIDDRGRKREGVFIDITDWEELRPTELNFHLMRLACQWNEANPFARATRSEQQIFNRHVGSMRWWNALVRDGRRIQVNAFLDEWSREAAAFQQRTRQLWLYPAPDYQPGVPGSELVVSTPR